MCVIIIKPRGVDMPSEDILAAAAQANPHGFGFVSETDYFRSLNLNTFLDRLAGVSRDENCIIHFRLATHGTVRRANCHPFRRGDVFMAHNGVLPVRPLRDRTDSQTAFNRIIYPAISVYGFGSENVAGTIESLIGGTSRIVLMQNGRIETYGQFYRRPGDGCL